jgi:hypothetical protein
MKNMGIVLSLALATMALAGNALAQGDKSVSFTTFYTNANIAGAPDSTLRLINDGDSGGNLWASFYVFDDSQELQECCSCVVSADGLLSESVNNELLANPLTGKVNHVGQIHVISSSTQGPVNNTPAAGLHGTATWDIAQNTKDVSSSSSSKSAVVSNAVNQYLALEHPLSDANLTSGEQTNLQNLCSYAITLGSGAGVCSCTMEDNDF